MPFYRVLAENYFSWLLNMSQVDVTFKSLQSELAQASLLWGPVNQVSDVAHWPLVKISLLKDIPFPLITKLKSGRSLGHLSVNRIQNIYATSPTNSWYKCLYFRFQFFILNLDKSLCTLLIIRIKGILMIDIHKNIIRFYMNTDFVMKKCKQRDQMARISCTCSNKIFFGMKKRKNIPV